MSKANSFTRSRKVAVPATRAFLPAIRSSAVRRRCFCNANSVNGNASRKRRSAPAWPCPAALFGVQPFHVTPVKSVRKAATVFLRIPAAAAVVRPVFVKRGTCNASPNRRSRRAHKARLCPAVALLAPSVCLRVHRVFCVSKCLVQHIFDFD